MNVYAAAVEKAMPLGRTRASELIPKNHHIYAGNT
jgi:hypothetical protein